MGIENNMWMPEARGIAAQCWCTPETQDREMDAALAEEFAKQLAFWMEMAARFARNEDFYRGLLDSCAYHLGPDVYVSDDGSVQDSPLRLKIPEMVGEMSRALSALTGERG